VVGVKIVSYRRRNGTKVLLKNTNKQKVIQHCPKNVFYTLKYFICLFVHSLLKMHSHAKLFYTHYWLLYCERGLKKVEKFPNTVPYKNSLAIVITPSTFFIHTSPECSDISYRYYICYSHWCIYIHYTRLLTTVT